MTVASNYAPPKPGRCDRNSANEPNRWPPEPSRYGSAMTERILILDFGSQVTQLIARRVRESGVYCEIASFGIGDDEVRAFGPRAIILSGGPASVTAGAAPRAPDIVFRLGVPVLGICYG